jgi:hypothetical protein
MGELFFISQICTRQFRKNVRNFFIFYFYNVGARVLTLVTFFCFFYNCYGKVEIFYCAKIFIEFLINLRLNSPPSRRCQLAFVRTAVFLQSIVKRVLVGTSYGSFKKY